MSPPAIAAVDLGAESCRVSLLQWMSGSPRVALVHRFANGPVESGGALRWNLREIVAGVEEGLRRSAEMAPEGIASIAVDGWSVDYVRLTGDGQAAYDPFCYRDPRTVAAEQAVHNRFPVDRLYQLTGAQPWRFNTVYQLYADSLAGIPAHIPWINLPEYVLYRLGGRRVAEYTNATHTGLIDLATRSWCGEIFRALDLDPQAAPPLVEAGSDIGELRGPLAALPAFRHTRLIAPACHDTASAIAGIPRAGDGWAYLSSGTWSLVGALLDAPRNTPEACRKGFTNQGGPAGRICFHKNINGMWLLRQSIEHWAAQGRNWSVEELIAQAALLPPPGHLFNVDAEDLLLPGNIPARINRQRQRAGLEPLSEAPQDAPAFAGLIFHSLAARYAEVLRHLTELTALPVREVYVVGGGSRNALLNRLAGRAMGLPLRTGHVESATIGNLAIQLAVLQASGAARSSPAAEEVRRWAAALSDV